MTPQESIELECWLEMNGKRPPPADAAEPVSTRHYHSDGESAGSILDLMGSH